MNKIFLSHILSRPVKKFSTTESSEAQTKSPQINVMHMLMDKWQPEISMAAETGNTNKRAISTMTDTGEMEY